MVQPSDGPGPHDTAAPTGGLIDLARSYVGLWGHHCYKYDYDRFRVADVRLTAEDGGIHVSVGIVWLNVVGADGGLAAGWFGFMLGDRPPGGAVCTASGLITETEMRWSAWTPGEEAFWVGRSPAMTLRDVEDLPAKTGSSCNGNENLHSLAAESADELRRRLPEID